MYAGIFTNILLLGYFKYADFMTDNINVVFGTHIPALKTILPLGISFFTFTQIAFLVDAHQRKMHEYSFLNYALFVTFFPHLLAGPIIHHEEMMSQFNRLKNKVVDHKHLFRGLVLFSFGLFKKCILADQFARYANIGFASAGHLGMKAAWITSLSYTMQIYFDFSGYTDMALGISWMFNIRLPLNFNSPYQALNISDFWRRWHMTLSRFLRDYVYIPLGGNRVREKLVLRNLALTFIIGGIWHGAGWTFIVWGSLHGFAMVVHRVWKRTGVVLPKTASWLITFLFINLTWIFFRAKSVAASFTILFEMFGLRRIILSGRYSDYLGFFDTAGIRLGTIQTVLGGVPRILLELIIAFSLILFARNSNVLVEKMRPSAAWLLAVSLMTVFSIMKLSSPSEFIYFNF